MKRKKSTSVPALRTGQVILQSHLQLHHTSARALLCVPWETINALPPKCLQQKLCVFSYVYICECVHVFMYEAYMYAGVYMYAHVSGGQRTTSNVVCPPVFETRSLTGLESPNKLGICMSSSACTGFMDLESTCLVFFHVGSGNQIQLFVLLRQAPLPHEPSPLSVFGRTYHSHKGF